MRILINPTRLQWATLYLAVVCALTACATPRTSLDGVAGPVSWRAIELRKGDRLLDGLKVYDATLVLTEAEGIDLTFTSIEPTLVGATRFTPDRARIWHLSPYCQLWLPLVSAGIDAPNWRVVLKGSSQRRDPIQVAIQVVLPADPTQLPAPAVGNADPAARLTDLPERGRLRLQVLTDRMRPRIVDLDPLLLSRDLPIAAELFGTAIRFGEGIPVSLHRHLRNLAASMIPESAMRGAVWTLALDLRPVGGDHAVFRLTFVEGFEQARRCAREILVERLAPMNRVPDLSGPSRSAHIRLDRGWSDRERGFLLAAVSRLPRTGRSAIVDVTFSRSSGATMGPEFLGHYDPQTHSIMMYDRAFEGSWTRFGSTEHQITDMTVVAIIHEVGHVLDLAPLRVAWDTFARAQEAVRLAFKHRENPPGSGRFLIPPDEEPLWKRLTEAAKATESQLAQVSSLSGNGHGPNGPPCTMKIHYRPGIF